MNWNKNLYEIPLKKVANNPFEAIYEYPITGNNLKVNGTHLFLPTFQKLYSKFYMNFIYENQKIFGFSQQSFVKHIKKVMFEDINSTFLANDHLAIVKAEGSWKDHETKIPAQPEDVNEPEETLFT